MSMFGNADDALRTVNRSNCRSCGAPVVWVIVQTTGKRMPLDPLPVADGNVSVLPVSTGQGVPYVKVGRKGAGQYVSHFSTCPDRDKWRKPKR